MSVTIEGLDELFRDAAEADRALSDGTRRAVAKACEEGAAEARQTHRFKNRSGDLERSIGGHVEASTPGGAEGVIEATDWKAEMLESGTKPHEIHASLGRNVEGPLRPGQSRSRRAKTSGLLRFQLPNGQWVSKASVQHPGTKADGFMGRAYLKAERVIEREVEVAAEHASDILNR